MFYMSLKYLLCGMAFVACATIARAFNNVPESISASIFLKVPGNDAKRYPLTFQKSQNNNGTYYLENSEKMPLTGLTCLHLQSNCLKYEMKGLPWANADYADTRTPAYRIGNRYDGNLLPPADCN